MADLLPNVLYSLRIQTYLLMLKNSSVLNSVILFQHAALLCIVWQRHSHLSYVTTTTCLMLSGGRSKHDSLGSRKLFYVLGQGHGFSSEVCLARIWWTWSLLTKCGAVHNLTRSCPLSMQGELWPLYCQSFVTFDEQVFCVVTCSDHVILLWKQWGKAVWYVVLQWTHTPPPNLGATCMFRVHTGISMLTLWTWLDT